VAKGPKLIRLFAHRKCKQLIHMIIKSTSIA